MRPGCQGLAKSKWPKPECKKLLLGESEKLDEGADEKPGFVMWI
jgi:hypothetical protein